MYLSKNLKYLIKKHNINQTIFALNIGTKPNNVSNWINGASNPDFNIIDNIANYFEVAPAELVYKDLSATEMTINIRANKGSNPNVQILDSVKESVVGYQVHTGHSNEEKLREENLNLKTRISFLEGQVQLLREILGK